LQEHEAITGTDDRKKGRMTTRRRSLGALVALLIVGAAFAAGYRVGGDSAAHPPVYIADGHVGADQASFQVGDTTYGFDSSVSWTDSAGSFHDSGWPGCLPKLQLVTGVRFAAAALWVGQVGVSPVVWVDCRSH
jgi:hypothetical protein